MKLTDSRRRALAALVSAHPGSARVSNETVIELGYVYWQSADWLLNEGLARDAYGGGALGYEGLRPSHLFTTPAALALAGDLDEDGPA